MNGDDRRELKLKFNKQIFAFSLNGRGERGVLV
jgi:hypothetical protein